MAAKGLPIATTGGFVVGDNGVLVIESMLNRRLARQHIALIRAVTDKPLLWLVNTSYHGDHSYGNYVFPRSTKVIQHVRTKAYVREAFEKDTVFMMQHFGKGRGIEQVVPRTGDVLIPKGGMMSIDLGGRTVEIRDFGFAQTGGDLFVWVPDAKVLWAGNAIIAPKPALPWLLDGHVRETLATMKRLYRFVPADARIVPGHGPVTGRQTVKWHIDYLSELLRRVRSAVAKGFDARQTASAVTMKDYGGYALHGWVHSGLNVPMAHKELSGN